ncbi:MAG: glycosyltransferase family 4 protein [Sedimentisphaerales bacterium]|nr:glycosyltransferase family 4 protein [Sedimentisphaerales bacterium]
MNRSSVTYAANEASIDVSAVRTLLRPVLIVSESTLAEQSAFLRHLLVGLVDESISTTLVCPPGCDVESLVPGPVAVLSYPLVSLPLARHLGTGYLAGELAKLRPTVLHSLSENTASLTRRLARRLRMPYVQMINSLAGGFSRVHLSPRRCRAIITPARSIAASVARAYPRFADRVRQIRIGTFIEEDTVCFSNPSRLPSIVLAQPLRRVSDFEAFFKVVKALLADGYDFMVVLMGNGPAEHGLRRLLEDLGIAQAVTIVPVLDPWRSVLAAGDIFVRPRPRRVFSMFLLEAMSLGTAVVACKGGVDDLIMPDRTALVFERDNEQSIRHALTQLLDQHDFARHLAMTAQEHVRAQHSVSQMVSATLKTYIEVQRLDRR